MCAYLSLQEVGTSGVRYLRAVKRPPHLRSKVSLGFMIFMLISVLNSLIVLHWKLYPLISDPRLFGLAIHCSSITICSTF